jgi:ribosomal protein S18 acetylase RimI-like enzyme
MAGAANTTLIRSRTPAMMLIRPFTSADEAAVVALWERCGLTRPWNDARKDIARKQNVQPELFLVGTLNDVVIATAMAGYEGHRGWINYLAVDPDHQHHGYGRTIMEAAEALLKARGCPKINLQVRGSNQPAIAFYQRIGFAFDDVVSLGKRLEHDGPKAQG